MKAERTSRRLVAVIGAASLGLAVGCSTPSAPQTSQPDDGQDKEGSTSLLTPSPDRSAPDLLRVHDGRRPPA